MVNRFLEKNKYPLLVLGLMLLAASAVYKIYSFNRAISLSSGDAIENIIYPDTSGKEVSTGDFKGKTIILHFWASWCVPCQDEAPEVVALYNTFRSNPGFEMMSISLDTDKNKWLKAWEELNFCWSYNLCDLKGTTGKSTQTLGITEIPAFVVIEESAEGKAKVLAADLDLPGIRKLLKDKLK